VRRSKSESFPRMPANPSDFRSKSGTKARRVRSSSTSATWTQLVQMLVLVATRRRNVYSKPSLRDAQRPEKSPTRSAFHAPPSENISETCAPKKRSLLRARAGGQGTRHRHPVADPPYLSDAPSVITRGFAVGRPISVKSVVLRPLSLIVSPTL